MLIKGKYTEANIFTDNIEEECIAQITKLVNHPAFTNPISIMPDTHAGKGSVVGFTMPLSNKVIPNVIGVDIGCGMNMYPLGSESLDSINHTQLDKAIRNRVPFGKNIHKKGLFKVTEYMDQVRIESQILRINKKYQTSIDALHGNYFLNLCNKIGISPEYAENSIGTLGGGNHFIEFCKSQNNNSYYLVIHSGSRNFGLKVCNYWQQKAKQKLRKNRDIDFQQEIQSIKESYPDREWSQRIKEARGKLELDLTVNINGLEWLEDEDLAGYLIDMAIAQEYAAANRRAIAYSINKILYINDNVLNKWFNYGLETIHNYINFDDMIIRKGAVSAQKDELFIVPLNMRDGVLICEGKGNKDWNYSAPHGAGRKMSRSKAKQKIQLETFEQQMKDIFSTSVGRSTLDEAPDAYKNSQEIIERIKETANIIDILKPIHNLKAT